jgi:phosphoglycerol transferase MdoB-like AlkP superfamily enzyme
MLPNLGYTFYDAIGLNAEDQAEDAYVIDHIKWIMYEHEKYFSFWITYTAHQPYSLDSLSDSMQTDYAKVEARYPNLSESEKVYFTKTMNLDHGIKKLLIDYKNAERLDDMVIIIYGDHYPKGLFGEDGSYEEICTENGNTADNCFDTPLIIWNNQIEAQVINKASSPLDIAPTIYDLFGLKYQEEITLGHSVFDPEYQGFNFDEYNIIQTNAYIYDTLRDTIVLRNWTKSEETYRLEAEALYQRLLLGYKVVENNYFASREYRERFVSN